MNIHARLLRGPVALAVVLGTTGSARAQAGTWSTIPTPPGRVIGNQTALLLTDGSILFNDAGDFTVWNRLTPDATGNYANGAWSRAASTAIGRQFFPEAVLADGRVFVAGGEFLQGMATDHNAVELYDPLLDVWIPGPDGLFGDIGDVGYQVLADGRVLVGFRFGPENQIFDPATDQWTAAANRPFGTGDEEGWVLLPNGSVFDSFNDPPLQYLPSQNQWVTAAVSPVTLVDASNEEVGPTLRLYNGNIFAIGGLGHTALFTPGPGGADPGSWAVGPDLPPNTLFAGIEIADDVPAAIEPNGKVIIVSTDQPFFGQPLFSEYDPVANTITQIQGPPQFVIQSEPFQLRFLVLPTGQILLTGTGTNDFLYTPVGAPQQVASPEIQDIVANLDGTFTLSGTQLNGLSQGAAYGDDGHAETNYPLVRLVDSAGGVHYARTFNHSTMGVATGTAQVTTTFAPPAGLPAGVYQASVVTNGIASPPVSLSIPLVVDASISVYSQWSTGYCANVVVTNTGPGAISQWAANIDVGPVAFNAHWNGNFAQNGRTLTVTSANQNGALDVGAQASLGYCAQGSTLIPTPVVASAGGR